MTKNFELIKKYIELQKDIMFDEVKNLGFAIVGTSKTDSSTFWNQAITEKPLSHENLTQIESYLKEKGRASSIYFESNELMISLKETLEIEGYKKNFEDSWNFYNKNEIDTSRFDNVKKVETKEDLKIFLQTLDECYQENDPQNPYGTLGEYIKVAEEAWCKNYRSNKLEYFIAYKDNVPVSVSSLTNYQGIGYISNIGSLKQVRGEGFGKLITLYCVYKARFNGANEVFLCTEEGHYPNEFYKRIGFETRFKAVCFTK